MSHILITGISKGIGLALASLALEKGHSLYGVARHLNQSPELMNLQKKYSNLSLIELDLTDPLAEEKLLKKLEAIKQIDILINNAGILREGKTRDDFLKSFEMNSYVPFMITEALVPKLKNSKQPKLIHITSIMGSITENESGGYVTYRASKTALNMIHKNLSLEYPWLACLAIHPGWVKTRMGGAEAPLSPTKSAEGIWRVVEDITLNETGQFKDYQGNNLPW